MLMPVEKAMPISVGREMPAPEVEAGMALGQVQDPGAVGELEERSRVGDHRFLW